MSLFIKKIPTRQHCHKVARLLNSPIDENVFIYHRGRVEQTRDDTDVGLDFRQESCFFYLSGVEQPGFHILIDVNLHTVYLIPPTVPDSETLWRGVPDSNEQLLANYDADEILRESELITFLQKSQPSTVHILDTTDTSFLKAAHIRECQLDTTLLKRSIHEARLTKFPWEVELSRYAAHISSHAHIAIMQQAQAGQPESYYEGLFRWVCTRNGMPRQAYIPIIASGPRAAILHYVRNNQPLPAHKHAMLLVDAGGEHLCYGTDITRTIPISGRFSYESRTIYDIVLTAQEAMLSHLKPGVMWRDVHNLGQRVLCQGLINICILMGELDELMQLGLTGAFCFHGTGHSVGLNVHDLLMSKPLLKNMVLAVEPGLYFNPVSLATWTKKPGYLKYFNMSNIQRFMPVGGVRIEDTILLTENGYENLTIAPKTVDAIEALMACKTQSFMDSPP
ncbi:peptidase M24, structural domain-containing protein [Spinellus fusiger]|nr:peptidase M24, structural domain-containing protein [Spinellus fusiger]